MASEAWTSDRREDSLPGEKEPPHRADPTWFSAQSPRGALLEDTELAARARSILGALRLVVLGLIAEEPRHGYDMIRLLKARFQASYSQPGFNLSSAGRSGPRLLFFARAAGASP
jgi:hypothetical protein